MESALKGHKDSAGDAKERERVLRSDRQKPTICKNTSAPRPVPQKTRADRDDDDAVCDILCYSSFAHHRIAYSGANDAGWHVGSEVCG